MKKIVIAALLATGLMAADSGVYVGVDVGSSKFSETDTYADNFGTGSESFKMNGTTETLKVGYYLNANNRVNAFVQNISYDGAKTYTYGVGYDYLIGDNAFKPFVGVFAGRNTINPDDGSSISGTIYGAQLGVNYAINTSFSVEAGYRYMKSSMKDSYDYSTPGNIDTGKFEADSISNWFIGANYKF